jgi:NAD(P)-dependent dehydrogenase (short-subunit alcohol dehydrogenase family)
LVTATYVVTGGGRGVGRAVAERLASHGYVIVVDRDANALDWTADRPAVEGFAGDATDEQTLNPAVEHASAAGMLTGWVNNAAVFRDAASATTIAWTTSCDGCTRSAASAARRRSPPSSIISCPPMPAS